MPMALKRDVTYVSPVLSIINNTALYVSLHLLYIKWVSAYFADIKAFTKAYYNSVIH